MSPINPPKISQKKLKNLRKTAKLKIRKNLEKKSIPHLRSHLPIKEKEVETNMKATQADKIRVDLGKMIETLNRIGMKLDRGKASENLTSTIEVRMINRNNLRIIEKQNFAQVIKM